MNKSEMINKLEEIATLMSEVVDCVVEKDEPQFSQLMDLVDAETIVSAALKMMREEQK